MHSPWLANKSRLLPRSSFASSALVSRSYWSRRVTSSHTCILGDTGRKRIRGTRAFPLILTWSSVPGSFPREHRSACGESTAVLCCPKQADSVPLSAAQADEETGETEGVMRYEMSGSVGMDGGVSAVVGSQAWVVSLEETGGTRAPTFSSFSVPPASSVWDLPRQWEWLVEKEVDGRNLAQHPWSLFNPRTSHVGRGTMRDIRTTFCAFNPQSSRVPFFSSMPTSEALSSPPDGHLRTHTEEAK